MPFFGGDSPPPEPEEASIGREADPAPRGPDGDVAAPGEAEFLRGEYQAAWPLLLQPYQEGNLRAVYLMRIMLEHGLHGAPPAPEDAQGAERFLALRYGELHGLAERSHAALKPLYHAALGHLYHKGLAPGTPRDKDAAVSEARFAMEAGFLPAYNLYAAIGCAADQGGLFGILKTGESDCFAATRRAAERSDVLAMGNLSALYREGVGTGKDPLKAVSWAYLASQKNPPSARALNDLGYFYETGEGVSRDLQEAKRHYSLAKNRYPLAKRNLDRLNKKEKSPPLLASGIDY
jgi:TPR repeat protein